MQTHGSCNSISGPVVQQEMELYFQLLWQFCSAEQICAILVEAIMGNNHMKFYIWISGSGDGVYGFFNFKLWWPFCSMVQQHFDYFW